MWCTVLQLTVLTLSLSPSHSLIIFTRVHSVPYSVTLTLTLILVYLYLYYLDLFHYPYLYLYLYLSLKLQLFLSLSLQVTIHTDTLNESCCVERTLESFKGRCIHTYHTEGAGGENLNVSEFVLFRIRLHQLFALTDIFMTAPFIPSFS